MIADVEVADPGMPTLVFGKLTSSVVVAVDDSGVGSWVVKACEELSEEDDLM